MQTHTCPKATGLALTSVLTLLAAEALRAIAADYPVQPVPFTAVRITGGFWQARLETNRCVTIPYDFRKCEETPRIANFARAGGLAQGKFEGIPFDDSDVYKVVEAAACSLATHPDPALDQYLDGLIAKFAAAQEPDGYLYTARTLGFTNDMTGPTRWSNLAHSHELYNLGHLYEAAVAHFQATGKRSLLNVALKSADLVCREFGPGPGQRKDVPGHEEIEIGLVKLYRVTGERRYLDQAKFFVDMRGRADLRGRVYGHYQQDHVPVLEQREAVGHAVRAGYLYAGVADVAALTGDAAYVRAIDALWQNVVGRKLHLTGGIGASPSGEAFGRDYELPNDTTYNETCAAIANALWNHRLFLLHGHARYADVLERILYNGFLSGISLQGDSFFYPNPLAHDGVRKFNHGSAERAPWFGCACCPPNIARTLPQIPGMMYAVRGDSLFVNLFATSEATLQLAGRQVRMSQRTAYPWDGTVRLEVSPAEPARFTLRVRVPGWARGEPVPSDLYRYVETQVAPVEIRVNNRRVPVKLEDGFAVLARRWQRGDVVELRLPMPVRRVLAHPAVAADAGRVALERGPLVYCVEGADNGGRVLHLALPDDAKLEAQHQPALLGGVTVIRGMALAAQRTQDNALRATPVAFTAIPYYAWCHRSPNEMTVWLPRDPKDAKPLAAAGGNP